MEFNSKTTNISKQRSHCLLVSINKNQQMSAAAQALDKTSHGALKKILAHGDLKKDLGSTLLISQLPNIEADRILLVRADKTVKSNEYLKIVNAAYKALADTQAKNATSYLEEIDVNDRDTHWKALQNILACNTATYCFSDFKSEKKPAALTKLTLHAAGKKALADTKSAVTLGSAMTAGINLTKKLGNFPSNLCTPSHLAKTAKALAKDHTKLKVTVLDEKQMRALKMGSLLAVGQGSEEPSKLITLEYNGGKKGVKPVVLVGKGVTFDSGGISIKPSNSMEEMKYDMLGAGTVLGVIKICCEYNLPLNVVGVVPTVENLPSGHAYKPGDILTSMSGKTIEVINTDAEGRLILCDALTYCKKFNPDVVIDMATLTGAVIVALGHEATGVMGNDQALIDDLLAASRASNDRAWQLPLWDDYRSHLKSDCADFANCGDRTAGTITAASFLSYFTEDYRWAHLDIAGTAWETKGGAAASGRPIPLLMQYLLQRCSTK